MINFAGQEKAPDPRIAKLRKTVVTITTVGVVVYVVVLAGWIGWWWYTLGRDKQVSSDVSDLLNQTNALADREITVRQLSDRAQAVLTEVAVPKMSDTLLKYQDPNVKIVGWDTSNALKPALSVSASSPAVLQDYATKIKQVTPGAFESLITWDSSEGWILQMVLGGKK